MDALILTVSVAALIAASAGVGHLTLSGLFYFLPTHKQD